MMSYLTYLFPHVIFRTEDDHRMSIMGHASSDARGTGADAYDSFEQLNESPFGTRSSCNKTATRKSSTRRRKGGEIVSFLKYVIFLIDSSIPLTSAAYVIIPIIPYEYSVVSKMERFIVLQIQFANEVSVFTLMYCAW